MREVPLTAEQRALSSAALAEYAMPGVGVAVVRAGTLAAEGFGLRDVPRALPMTPDSPQPICSLSKSFTAAAIMQLVEAGLVDLDEPVVRYLPEFRLSSPPATHSVTPRMLLAHTGGLGRTGHQDAMFQAGEAPYRDRADLLSRLHAAPLQTAPGATYSYCNEGYVVLGLLLERVSGAAMEDYYAARLFAPAGMTRTYTRFADWRADELRAVGHRADHYGFLPTQLPADYGIYLASGGVCSTARDMGCWLAAHLDERSPLLSEPSLRLMQSVVAPFGDTGWGYGLGWEIARGPRYTVVGHDGSLPELSTRMLMIPEEQLGVVVLANGDTWGAIRLAEALTEQILGAPLLRAEPGGPLAITSAAPRLSDPAAYCGAFRFGDSRLLVAQGDGGLLIASDAQDPELSRPAEVIHVGGDVFMDRRLGNIYTFLCEEGPAAALLIGGERYTREGREHAPDL